MNYGDESSDWKRRPSVCSVRFGLDLVVSLRILILILMLMLMLMLIPIPIPISTRIPIPIPQTQPQTDCVWPSIFVL